MPAAIRCPHCKNAYHIDNSAEDRTFKCRACGKRFEFRGRPDKEPEVREKPKPKWRANLSELPGWAVAGLSAAILAGLWFLATLGMGQLGEPHDRLYHALGAEYSALADIVADLETTEDVAAARPEIQAHMREIDRLLADPRPFGRSKTVVGAAFLREYEGAMAIRLEELRDAKSEVFEIQGVGGEVSALLRPIPQTEPQLARALDG